jgi:coenzyme PQQ synthesis protein D (PqqD)
MPLTRPRIRTDLSFAEVDGEAVVYHHGTNEVHYLNPTATLAFRLFDGTATVGELSREIAGEYDARPSDVEMHMRTVLREFGELSLLSDNGDSAPELPPEDRRAVQRRMVPRST